MVVLEDFTRVSAGRYVPAEGHVVVCPRCGRSGIQQHSEQGALLFVHAQTSEVLGDGMLTEPQDSCTVASAARGDLASPPDRGSPKPGRPRA